jgi:hypothetical protein
MNYKELLDRVFRGEAPKQPEKPLQEEKDAELPASAEPAIEEFKKHFMVTGVRVPGPKDSGIPYADWKARELNRIFAEHGTGGPGRITGHTVQHGLAKQATAAKRRNAEQE